MKDTIEIIQRLVDGEIKHDERQKVIEYLDSERPEAWRDVALGFIENQIIADAFQSAEVSKTIVQPSNVVPMHMWLGGLAAMLTLGLGIGWLIFSSNDLSDASQLTQLESEQDTASTDLSKSLVLDSELNAQPLLPDLSSSNELINKIEEAYVEKGIQPVHQQAYITASFSNGENLIIPLNYMAIPRQ